MVSLAAALALAPTQALVLAGGQDGRDAVSAVPLVLWQTGFGRALLLRLALVLVALLLLRPATERRDLAILLLAVLGAALVLQTRMGHAAAAPLFVPFALAMHILGASLWIGGLAALLDLLIRDRAAGVAAARRFAPFGLVAVLALVAGGGAAGFAFAGAVPELVGTPYGLLLLAKVALLAAMLALAASNLFLFARRGHVRRLRASVAFETCLGLSVVSLAALLATLPPAIHAPVDWPFPSRLAEGILADPYLARPLRDFGAILALAAGLLAAGLWLRRMRLPLLAASAASLAFLPALPPSGLYLEPAVPTSFRISATGRTVADIARGGELFGTHCAACHGGDARGRGSAATGDPVWPPDLSAPLFRRRSDGELFWSIGQGVRRPDGRLSMPGFASRIEDGDLWRLVDYVRLQERGRAIASRGPDGTVAPVRAPPARMLCTDDEFTLGRARPRATLLVLGEREDGGSPDPARLQVVGPSTGCRFADRRAAGVYAALAGWPGADTGASLMIDAHGWVRAVWPPGDLPGDRELLSAVRRFAADPVREETRHGH